jgi:hypothetical protein
MMRSSRLLPLIFNFFSRSMFLLAGCWPERGFDPAILHIVHSSLVIWWDKNEITIAS